MTAPSWACRSSTSSRTSRWAPAAGSPTSRRGCGTTPRWSSTVTCCRAPICGALLASHRDSGADVTLHLVRVGDPRAFGCVPTDADGVVTAFLEKTEDPPTDQINAGCYVFKREVIDRLPKGRALSVEREVFPQLLADGLQGVRLCRRDVLARHGHAGGLRARLGRPGSRDRAVARARTGIEVSRWCTTARRCRPARC